MFQHTAARRRLGDEVEDRVLDFVVSTHSRPKAAGVSGIRGTPLTNSFQHTAARRRLAVA